MKINKLLYVLAFVGAFAFTSCEEEALTGVSQLGNTVYFQDSSTVVTENGGVATLTIYRAGSDFSAAVTVGLTASSQFGEATDFFEAGADAAGTYVLSATSVTFGANESEASVTVTGVDDLLASGVKNITVTIGEVAGFNSGTVGGGSFFASQVVSLSDDDCPVSIADWVGTYTVFENFTSGTNAPSGLNNFFGESYQLEATLDPTDATGTRIVFNNSAGFDTYISNGIVMTFLTCSAEVTFSEAAPNVALFRDFAYETATYTESSFTINAAGPLATFGPYQFTFTKQ